MVEGDDAFRGPQLERANNDPKGAAFVEKMTGLFFFYFFLPRNPDSASMSVQCLHYSCGRFGPKMKSQYFCICIFFHF